MLNVVAVLDAEGHTARFEYDAMNRRVAVVDATGYRTETQYNLRGDVVGITNANGEKISFEIDALGRKTDAIDARGYRSRYGYDESGHLTCSIDANADAGLQPMNMHGCSQNLDHDELGRLTRTTDALNGQTRFTHDLLGNRLSVTDAQNKTWAFAHDDLGRPISETDHSGRTTTYKLDEAGNVYETTNRLGEVTRTSHDAGNRPTRVDYLKDNTAESFGYDPAGNLNAAANQAVGYAFGWDRLNRLVAKLDSRAGVGTNKTLSFSYDKVGNMLTKTTYQGSTTRYVYNAANRLVMLQNPDYTQVNYQFDPAGRLLSRVTANGARSSYQYDANGWLTRLSHYDAHDQLASPEKFYSHDHRGNITGVTDVYGFTQNIYDALDRLTFSGQIYPSYADSEERFTYDAVGNRLTYLRGSRYYVDENTRHYTYTPVTNRLANVRIGSATGTVESSFSYDHEGRLTTQTGVGAKTLTWDAKGRVKTVGAESYSYDPTDHRIGRSGGTLGNRSYYLEGEHLESEYSGATLLARYFRGSSTDELVAAWISDSDGQIKPYLFHHDQVNSVIAVTGHNGGTKQTIDYTAFGQTRNSFGFENNPSRLKYTGREDDGTGLYYYRARYYDPQLGRFISEDPIGFASGDMSFYVYGMNNPVNFNDPMGLMPNSWESWKNLGKSTVGMIANGATVIGGGSLILGGSAVAAAGPEGVNQLIGYGTISLGSVLVGKGAGGVALNAQNFSDAWNNRPASVPTSVPRLIAEGYAPGNKSALVAADVIDFGTDLAALKVPVGGYYNSAGVFVRQNSMQASNWEAATKNIEHLPFLTVAAPGTSIGTAANVFSTFAGGASNAVDWAAGTACTTCSAANGGFVLYPNKPNTNQMQSVYQK